MINNEKKQEGISFEYGKTDPTMDVDSRIINILSTYVMNYVTGPKILEMGIGVDQYTEKVISKFGHSYIVEISKKLIDEANVKYKKKITTFQSSFENFKPELKFDTILATNILEHVDNRVDLLKNLKTWINDNGKIILIVPNANSLHRLYGVSLGILKTKYDLTESDLRLGHYIVYDKESLEFDIVQSGLKINTILPTYIKLLSNSQMANYTDIQLFGLFKLANKLPLEYSASLFYICSK